MSADFTGAAVCATLFVALAAVAGQGLPRSRAERTQFEETSSGQDVRAFLESLASQTPRMRVESFGMSEEGRPLPLVVIGDPPLQPDEARKSGRPIVLVIANIHAGEVEGKEALLHLTRRLTTGDLRSLVAAAVWLFAPNYNADGNDRVSVENRTDQHGPVGGVGTRENARGLDLNRDFMKLESAEARALVALMSRWDPDIVVDLHTTDGSYHGYHLTYSPPLNPNAEPRLIAFARERLLPAVRSAMSARHRLRTYYYGNFTAVEALDTEHARPSEAQGTPAWRTFDHRPRFGNNYVGLRNRIAILSEAYSHLDFAGRVRATEAFVEEIMRFVAANGADVRAAVSRADADWVRQASGAREAGIAFELRAFPGPTEILVGAVEPRANPRSTRPMIAMIENVATPMRMPEYGTFGATRTRRVPREYYVKPAPDGLHAAIARKLQEHGVRVETTAAPRTIPAEQMVVEQVRQAERQFQGHRETSIAGRFERRTDELPAGSLVVRTDQPLGRLVFYLLEPESDDSLATWNLMDGALTPGAVHPVLKSMP